MSERAYYSDSYTTTFAARIIEQVEDEAGWTAVLDKSYFYPTSGGQPCDRGTIDGQAVIDVVIRPQDGAVLHRLAERPQAEEVEGIVDWFRRFDHMQQHTGQHILSQAFIQVAGAQTVGFHLSDDSVTIDLDSSSLSEEVIRESEMLANQIVWQDRAVSVRWATPEEAQELALRKIPATVAEKLRLIDIAEFDLTACGGTHVARTGEVGQISVTKQESRNNKIRIHFQCGRRALEHHRAATQALQQLTTQLTTGVDELLPAVIKLQGNEKEARRITRQLQSALDALQAEQLLSRGAPLGDDTLIVRVFSEESPARLRGLAAALIQEPHAIALLASVSDRTHFVFGRSDSAQGDMKQMLQSVFERLGHGSGGGNQSMAQGAAEYIEPAALQEIIRHAAASQFE